MSDAGFDRLRHLFGELLERPADQRWAFLDSLADADADLRSGLAAMLDAHGREDSFLDPGSGPGADLAHGPLGAHTRVGQAIGHYRVVRLIATGGMGAVYEAEQEQPRRRVALKLVHPGLVSEGTLSRFKREAEILGSLHHPGIAEIHEWGTWSEAEGLPPVPFIAMELIDGDPLTTNADESNLDRRARIELLVQVCEAVAYAHSRGVVHRDLKPSNVLVDRQGAVKLLDFGVARMTEADLQVSTLLTSPGMLLGTLGYMSPEQALGRGGLVDERTDVHALGVLLFELLTGRLPYDLQGRAIPEALRTLEQDEPLSLAAIDSKLAGDLAVITAKALEKDPQRRYRSATELAEDLRRHLAHEPIRARPTTTAARTRKWVQRNPAKSTVGSLVLAALLVVSGLGVMLQRRTADLEQSNERTRGLLLAHSSAAVQERDETLALQLALEAVRVERNPETVSQLHGSLARLHEVASIAVPGYPRGVFLSPDGLSLVVIADGSRLFPGAALLLRPGSHEPIELGGHGIRLRCAAWSPTGEWFVTADVMRKPEGGQQGSAILRDPQGELLRVLYGPDELEPGEFPRQPADAHFTPDGRGLLLTGTRGTLWAPRGLALYWPDVLEGEPIRLTGLEVDGREVVPTDVPFYTSSVSATHIGFADRPFSVDEQTISRPTRAWIFERSGLEAGKAPVVLEGHTGWITTLAFAPSPMEDLILTASTDGTARLWTIGGEPVGESRHHPHPVSGASFSPDGARFLTFTGRENKLRLWAVAGGPAVEIKLDSPIVSGAHLPDGNILLGLRDGSVKLLDSEGSPRDVFSGQAQPQNSLSWSRDGGRVVSSSLRDANVHIWQRRFDEFGSVKLHDSTISDLALSPDGSVLATLSRDNLVGVWDAQTLEALREPVRLESRGWSLAFHPRDSNRLALALDSNGSAFVSIDSGVVELQGGLPSRQNGLRSIGRFAPSGAWFAVSQWDTVRSNYLSIRHVDPDRAVQQIPLTVGPNDFALNSAGTLLAVAAWDQFVVLEMDPEGTLGPVKFPPLPGRGWRVLFSPGEPDMLVTSTLGGGLTFWSLGQGEMHSLGSIESSQVQCMSFSPDGTLFAIGGSEDYASLWRVEDRKLITRLPGHSGPVTALTFSPDGGTLYTTSWDGRVHRWIVDTEELIETAERVAARPLSDTERQAYASLLGTATEEADTPISRTPEYLLEQGLEFQPMYSILAHREVARILEVEGRTEEALEILLRGSTEHRRHDSPRTLDRAAVAEEFVSSQLRDRGPRALEEGVRLARWAMEVWQELAGEGSQEWADSALALLLVLTEDGQDEEALEVAERLYESLSDPGFDTVHRSWHTSTTLRVAEHLTRAERGEDALALLLLAARRHLESDLPRTKSNANQANGIAWELRVGGAEELEEAARLVRWSIDVLVETEGVASLPWLNASDTLGVILLESGRSAAALEVLQDVVERAGAGDQASSTNFAGFCESLAACQEALGLEAEARATSERGLAALLGEQRDTAGQQEIRAALTGRLERL